MKTPSQVYVKLEVELHSYSSAPDVTTYFAYLQSHVLKVHMTRNLLLAYSKGLSK